MAGKTQPPIPIKRRVTYPTGGYMPAGKFYKLNSGKDFLCGGLKKNIYGIYGGGKAYITAYASFHIQKQSP